MTSLDEAFALVDVVTIATPPDTHPAIAIKALEAGKAVICEKPFALSTAEALAMENAANRAARPAFIGHEFRYAEDRVVVERTIATGIIGEPRLATFTSYAPLVADPAAGRMPEWWFDRAREEAGSVQPFRTSSIKSARRWVTSTR